MFPGLFFLGISVVNKFLLIRVASQPLRHDISITLNRVHEVRESINCFEEET